MVDGEMWRSERGYPLLLFVPLVIGVDDGFDSFEICRIRFSCVTELLVFRRVITQSFSQSLYQIDGYQ